MNVLQHTRNEQNPCLKQNRPDRSYRDTLLTKKLPRGGSSIILQENAGRWRAFTGETYKGAFTILEPGKRYKSLEEMGLGNPVKSFRKEF